MDDNETQERSPEASEADRKKQEKMASILRRVDAGDTSVVSEVYWLQIFGEDEALK
jgi:hypothetical protein